MDSCLNINNLMPTPEMLFQAAYGSLVGDPRTPGFGEASLARAMDALERTRGGIINGHLGPGAGPA